MEQQKRQKKEKMAHFRAECETREKQTSAKWLINTETRTDFSEKLNCSGYGLFWWFVYNKQCKDSKRNMNLYASKDGKTYALNFFH